MTLLEETLVMPYSMNEEVITEEKTVEVETPDLADIFEVVFNSEPLMLPILLGNGQDDETSEEKEEIEPSNAIGLDSNSKSNGKDDNNNNNVNSQGDDKGDEDEKEDEEEEMKIEVRISQESTPDEEVEEAEEDIACMPFLCTERCPVDSYISLDAPPGLALINEYDEAKALQEDNPDFVDTEDDGCSTPSSSEQPSIFMPVRKASDADFFEKNQTLIILDWDDTLCPSSYCMEVQHLYNAAQPPAGSELEAELQDLAGKVQALFEKADSLAATVAIVTNAGERWVDMSSTAWMPQLQPVLATTAVSSARSKWEAFGISTPTGWKTHEFRQVIDDFYSRYDDQSWKNVICVGDAPYEHEALQYVLEGGGQKSAFCRRKSMKFMIKPTIKHLASQVERLTEQLEGIVAYDGTLEIDFGALITMEAVSS